jgi:hypothetical protein
MKNVILFAVITTLLFGCNPNEDLHKESSENLELKSSQRAPGVLPRGIGLNEIIQAPTTHTWKDLDNYYRVELPRYRVEDYYENLRELVLNQLVLEFDMPKNAHKETLEFYINEMCQVDLIDPDAFIRTAVPLLLHSWSKEKIRELAKERYEKNMMFIQTLDNPERVLAKHGERFEKLRKFSETFPNRWGSYDR